MAEHGARCVPRSSAHREGWCKVARFAAYPRCWADLEQRGEGGWWQESMIKKHMYVLAVPNLERSSAFYRDVLGFEVREMAAGWLLYVKDSCSIMAGECPAALSPQELGDHSYFGYLVVDRVEEYHDRAVAAGAEVVKPLREEPWGMREFGLRTADGHRLMIGSESKAGQRTGGPTSG